MHSLMHTKLQYHATQKTTINLAIIRIEMV
jgi:hypothetical protein